MTFDSLGLSKKVLKAVEASGYTIPTPIQEQAIPHVLEHRDVLGIAQTGTGKTAGFVLPMLSLLEKGRARARMPRTLILEPTRELAAQVHENFEKYGQNHKLSVALLIGGVSFDEQNKILDRGADVLIATPGRLLDHFERGRLLMTGVEILVIDEADRMLDMGFIPDIERIVKLVPFTRQTLFFSATMPPEIDNLAKKFLQNPVSVEVSKPASASATIVQRAVASPVDDWEKRAVLRKLIDEADDLQNAIIFCNRKIDVANLWKSLDRHGYSAGALHGDMDQSARTATLKAFKDGKIKILVASDVAARGLDIPEVSHVFNFDVSVNAEDYVHRIGRTGRAGRKGAAFMIVTPVDQKGFEAIEDLIGETIEWQGEKVEWDARAGRRGRGRGKPSRPEKPARRQREGGDKASAKSGDRGREKDSGKDRERGGRKERTEARDARDTAPAERKRAAKGAGRDDNRSEKRSGRSGGRRNDGQKDLVASDQDHAFGGEENVPAFLQR
ncbi:DEAD/DEAH box helicase [Salaquimonas pukyongi]|uniref:DEAD/DEAH box helicase n=1 Tax=Salaquimonas pukyongi TaxID=2712698 RepID=UPI00096BA487|nr:DEAD/DEAH box helicase [Salaquimonas pukyongi]